MWGGKKARKEMDKINYDYSYTSSGDFGSELRDFKKRVDYICGSGSYFSLNHSVSRSGKDITVILYPLSSGTDLSGYCSQIESAFDECMSSGTLTIKRM